MKKLILTALVFLAANKITAQHLAVNATHPSVQYQTVTVGINEISTESSVKIYPNPTTSEVTIVSQEGYQLNSSELYIYDATGKMVVHEKNIIFKEGAYTVNVANLENGLYSLIINTKDRKAAINKKFVVGK